MAQIKHIDLETKTCNRCQEDKPATTEFFSPHKGSLNSRCKLCAAEAQAKFRANLDPDEARRRSRQYSLKTLYKITPEEYEQMVESQNGLCAICKQEPSPLNTRPIGLVVDHDHVTKENRGLLCDLCNRGIGMLGDDPDRLFEAATYLLQWRK